MADNNPVKGGYTYTFVGTHAPEAKASIGDKNDQNKWPILWEAGDQLGVYDANSALVGVAELAAESAGQNQGTFTVAATRELVAGEALTLKYPYAEGEAFVPTKQTQLAVSSSAGLGANAVASATTTFAAAGTSFSLSHANAYVRFELASEEFKDYTLNGVTLWCKGEKLSGDGDGQDYVKVTLGEPVVLGQEAKYIWMTANNVDLSDKDFYAIVHMTKGIETVTLPVSLKGKGVLKAHAVTSIKLPKLVKSLAPAWYEPIETRYIAAYGEGWCYGPENTVLFEKYNTEQPVELKARGNFMKVKEPKYVQMVYLADRNQTYKKVTIDGTTIEEANLSTVLPIGENTTIRVKHQSQFTVNWNNKLFEGQMAGMYVLDAEKTPIWGINLWLSVNKIQTFEYNDGVVMDRNLGADLSTDATHGSWRASGCFFQWGRPFAFPMGSQYTNSSASSLNVTSLEVSANNPYTMYYKADSNSNDWYRGPGKTNDFWGNPNEAGTDNVYVSGTKSIFDPCPKGYMVVCPTILKEVEDNIWKNTDETKNTEFVDGSDMDRMVYKGVNWYFSGLFACDVTSGVNWKKQDRMGYWANSNVGDTRGRSLFLTRDNAAAFTAKPFTRNRHKFAAHSVRCMVDTENR